MPPYHLDDLCDYHAWLEQQLDYSGGTLETPGQSLDVQLLDSPTLLVVERQRLRFPNGYYLDLKLRVSEDLTNLSYGYHLAAPNDSLVWRLDKHRLSINGPAIPHVHEPPDKEVHKPHAEVFLDEVLKRIHGSGVLALDPQASSSE